jgi:hypothetical protein
MLPKAASVGFVALTSAALAGTASQNLGITATVVNGCTIRSVAEDAPVRVSCNSILSHALQRGTPHTTRWEKSPDSDVVLVTVTF